MIWFVGFRRQLFQAFLTFTKQYIVISLNHYCCDTHKTVHTYNKSRKLFPLSSANFPAEKFFVEYFQLLHCVGYVCQRLARKQTVDKKPEKNCDEEK